MPTANINTPMQKRLELLNTHFAKQHIHRDVFLGKNA